MSSIFTKCPIWKYHKKSLYVVKKLNQPNTYLNSNRIYSATSHEFLIVFRNKKSSKFKDWHTNFQLCHILYEAKLRKWINLRRIKGSDVTEVFGRAAIMAYLQSGVLSHAQKVRKLYKDSLRLLQSYYASNR